MLRKGDRHFTCTACRRKCGKSYRCKCCFANLQQGSVYGVSMFWSNHMSLFLALPFSMGTLDGQEGHHIPGVADTDEQEQNHR